MTLHAQFFGGWLFGVVTVVFVVGLVVLGERRAEWKRAGRPLRGDPGGEDTQVFGGPVS